MAKPWHARVWLVFRARWNGKPVERAEEELDSKLTRAMSKFSRLCILVLLFQTSLFTVYADKLKSKPKFKANERRRQQNQSAPESETHLDQLARSARLKRWFKIYSSVSIAIYGFLLLVSLVTILLDSSLFRSLRYLDCYILGRYGANAPISREVKYFCFIAMSFNLGFRLVVIWLKPTSNFQLLDFMQEDLDTVERQAGQGGTVKVVNHRTTSAPMLSSSLWQPHTSRYTSDCTAASAVRAKQFPEAELDQHRDGPSDNWWCDEDDGKDDDDDDDDGADDVNEVLFARTSYLMEDLSITKLNRSSKCWFRLNLILLLAFIVMLAIYLPYLAAILYPMTPTVVTKRGFEFSYPNCVSHIREYVQGNETRTREYESIYKVTGNRDNANMLDWNELNVPLENLVTGRYHQLRICLDYLLTVLVYTNEFAFFSCHAILQLLIGYELKLNSNELHTRLKQLYELQWRQPIEFDLERKRQGRRIRKRKFNSVLEPNSNRTTASRASPIESYRDHYEASFLRHRSSLLERPLRYEGDREFALPIEHRFGDLDEATRRKFALQALIVDHFRLIIGYNEYMSLKVVYYFAIWLLPTTNFLVWMTIADGKSTRLEYYLIQLLLSVAGASHLLFLTVIQRKNRAFYPLMTSLMANDSYRSVTKLRWANILKYYHPKPLYCFTLASTEVSTMLVTKVSVFTIASHDLGALLPNTNHVASSPPPIANTQRKINSKQLIAWFISALVVIISLVYERSIRAKLTMNHHY